MKLKRLNKFFLLQKLHKFIHVVWLLLRIKKTLNKTEHLCFDFHKTFHIYVQRCPVIRAADEIDIEVLSLSFSLTFNFYRQFKIIIIEIQKLSQIHVWIRE